MDNKHQAKYVNNLFTAFIFVNAAIFLVFYSRIADPAHHYWIPWSLGVGTLLTTGLLLGGSAFVHKVKADLIRRQRRPAKDQPA
ncbi:hypothetical protein JMG10_33425 [Nostoc ellipsosporum NOK]|jgi:Zn-dependent protease|nr:hypothetical protein [Nostoc ellipsosporum NOK]